MALSADLIIDRRRLRRKLTFWRVAAFVVAACAVAGLALSSGVADRVYNRAKPQIAKVRIEGAIYENDELIERLGKIADSSSVKGVILAIDTPGGTTTGGEAIFEAVRKLAEKKPVVAEVGTLAASAGYMIASATDHIVARRSSIVGSIGVLFQYPDLSALLDKVGVKVETIKSSPLKAEPNFFNPASDEAKAMIRRMIMDSYDWFVGLVEDRRGFTHEQALALSDGSVFTGRQALENKLVDAIGGEDVALAWLKTRGVDTSLDVIEWKPKPTTAGFLLSESTLKFLAERLGLPGGDHDLLQALTGKRNFLDGLVSVWHVDGEPGGVQ